MTAYAGYLIVAAVAAGLTADARPSLTDTLAEATTMCSGYDGAGMVKLTLAWEQFMDLPPALASRSNAKPLTAMPPLAQRYMQTAPSVRAAGHPFAVFHLPTDAGDVWVFPGKNGLCDVMVTGGNGFPAAAAAFADALDSADWDSVKRTDASQSMPLAERLLVKRSPLPDDPNFGTRAQIQWLTMLPSNKDGVQLEINFASGTIRLPTPAPQPNPK